MYNCLRPSCLILFVPLISMLGCSGNPYPFLEPVSGTVTRDGTPLNGVFVTFVPAKGRPSAGYTDASGKYELKFMHDVYGATQGANQVLLEVPLGQQGKSSDADFAPQTKTLRWPEQVEVIADGPPMDFDITKIPTRRRRS